MAKLSKTTPLKRFHKFSIREYPVPGVQSDAPGRLGGHGPIGIIDIGSNSVRLVAYERLSRTPTPFFNEKALCGLGKGLSKTGALSEEAVEAAIAAIHRFKTLSDQMQLVDLHVLATAAAREASNGADFIERVAEVSGAQPFVLSGDDEAFYSAKGIISGIYQPDGIIGDMGGGSVEFARIDGDEIGKGETTPLGGLRLADLSDGNLKKASKIADAELQDVKVLKKGEGRDFYAVGGTWRALAHLHMHQVKYPLHVLHQYSVSAKDMARFCDEVIASDVKDLPGLEAVSKNRRELLHYGAVVMRSVLNVMKPANVVISALGVREGYLFDLLDDDEYERDPLFCAAMELNALRSRSPMNGVEMIEWTDQLFKALEIDESDEDKRLRWAACLLSDVGWRAHPDYRGEHSADLIAHAAFVGIDHPGRAWIAMSVFHRHEGDVDESLRPQQAKLLNSKQLQTALTLGTAFRLAYLLSAAMPGVLENSYFKREKDVLILVLEHSMATLVGERLLRRLGQLVKPYGIDCEVEVED